MQPALRLDQLPLATSATIQDVDWTALGDDGRRLRNLGFDEGVRVTPLHKGPIGADPLAVRVGRMTVAIRRAHARAVAVAVAN